MTANNLILFGKHPAWPDHVFLPGTGGDFASCLKREFYDRSIVAASTAHVGPERLAYFSFVFNRGSDFALVVGRPSRDSVGRSRFPLFAAISLAVDAYDAINLESLTILQGVLGEFLESLLDSDAPELMADRDAVESARASFKLPSLNYAASTPKLAESGDFIQLLRGISAGEAGFSFAGNSFAAAFALAECGCRQFRTRPDALLAFCENEAGPGFFISRMEKSGFPLSVFLLGDTPNVREADWPDVAQVEAISSGIFDFSSMIEPTLCPVLGISSGPSRAGSGRNFRKAWIGLALLILILLGIGVFIFAPSRDDEQDTAMPRATPEAVEATRQLWTEMASNYLEWIAPLIEFIDKLPEKSNFFTDLRRVANTPLNPFVIFDPKSDRAELVKNPGSRIFRTENTQVLESVAANQRMLVAAVDKSFAMMDAKPLLDQLRGLGVDLGGLDTIGSESAQSESSISYGPELVEDFELAWVQYRDRTEALEQMRRFETEILGPIRDKMPDLAASLVAIISNELQSGKGDVDGVFRNLRKQVQHDWLLQANSLDSAALARSDTWSALLQGTANLQHLSQQLAYLQNYELMEAELFTRETANIENAVQQVNAKLANARSKFPDEVFLDQETATEIDEVTVSASKWPEMARHRRNYESVQAATFKAVSRLELIEKQIDSQLGRLIDPSLWLVDKEPQVDSMKDGGLRQKLASLLTSLQVKYSALADQDRVGAYEAFDRDANLLIVQFFRLDRAISEWALVETGLAWSELQLSVSKEIVRLVDELVNPKDSADGIGIVVDKVVAVVGEDLQTFAAKMKWAEATYAGMDRGVAAPSELLQTYRELRMHSLGGDQLGRHTVSILEIASSAEAVDTLGSVAISLVDLFWILQGTLERGDVSEALLKAATVGAKQFSAQALNEAHSLRSAWEQALSRLMLRFDRTSIRFAELGAAVDSLIPSEWVATTFRMWQVVSVFRMELEASSPDAVPAEAMLRQRAAESSESKVVEFWRSAAEFSKSLGEVEGSQFDGLDVMVEASALIQHADISEDYHTVDLVLDKDRTLRFLLLDTGTESVFISASPLTIAEFFALFRAVLPGAGTLRDRFWPDLYPRSFDSSGSSRGFTDLGSWLFGPNKNSNELDIFSPDQQVMHQSQPALANEFAEELGLRLPRPDEIAALIEMKKNDPLILPAVNFDDVNLKETLQSYSFEASVYRNSLEKVKIEAGWTGGFAFEPVPRALDRKRFYDVIGGAAELSYDGERYYGQGASWLFAPTDVKELVELEDGAVYVDLGVRFAFPPPERSVKDKLLEWLNGELKNIEIPN